MRASIIYLAFMFFPEMCVVAQAHLRIRDFGKVDSFALSIQYHDDYVRLAKDLGSPWKNDVMKARSIFRWITANISYDYRFANTGEEITEPECESQIDCQLMKQEWEHRYIRRILKSKKAVADGYARLFQKLCEINRIQTEMIKGYARTKPYQVGNNMSVNHSWNAIMLDTSWYYADPTWAAGFCNEHEETGLLTRFIRSYTDYYWIKDFATFSRNHYPQKGMMVEASPLTREQFFNKPFYYSAEILENLEEVSPATGVLKLKKGEKLCFVFRYAKDIKLIQVNSNIFRNPSLWTTVKVSRKKTKLVKDTWAEKKQQYIPFTRDGNTYSFEFTVKEESLYYLELVFDFKPAIRYRVRVEN